jgi:hypothetical protein
MRLSQESIAAAPAGVNLGPSPLRCGAGAIHTMPIYAVQQIAPS